MRYETSRICIAAALVLCLAPLPGVAASADNNARVDAMAIYNRGSAVVQTTRDVDLEAGDQTIGWPISGRLRADTLWLEGDGVRLTGLSVPAGGNDGSNLLAARVGQPVTLLRDGTAAGTDTQMRAATLVGIDGDSLLVRVDDRIERLTADSPWRIAWPAADAEHDGLQLDVDADKAGSQPLTATYQIDGPSWQASYTGRFDAKTGRLSLQSMAVIDNSGGAHLAADRAWLVAGDVARAGGGPRSVMMARSEAKFADSAPQAAGDVYRYQLDGGLDIAAGATRAVSLMRPVSFDAKRRYRFENSALAARRDGARSHAEVRLRFVNSADAPLPAGTIRVYDGQRTAGLLGEDRIGDTPKGAPVTLTLGRAFDITDERDVVADEKSDAGQRKRSIEITLRNAGGQQASVDVVEHLPPAAEMVSASPATAPDSEADTGTWQIDVPAHGKTVLRYTVQWPTQ